MEEGKKGFILCISETFLSNEVLNPASMSFLGTLFRGVFFIRRGRFLTRTKRRIIGRNTSGNLPSSQACPPPYDEVQYTGNTRELHGVVQVCVRYGCIFERGCRRYRQRWHPILV